MKKFLTVLICLTMLLLTACGAGKTEPLETTNNGILSGFTTTDLEGNTVDQSVLEDYDLTMVNVWATFCNPCLREMPDLGELAAEYEAKGVQFLGLVSDTLDREGQLVPDQVEEARRLVEETGADYVHLLPSEDLMGLLGQIYAVPTTFFVDSQGNQVGSAVVKAQTRDQWIKTIDSVLAQLEG